MIGPFDKPYDSCQVRIISDQPPELDELLEFLESCDFRCIGCTSSLSIRPFEAIILTAM